ncbi:hypothetical protein [Streptomyces hawaiiensis]|uniref:hypothetical protein n=1 Tax=Streptomyces hawaiiensis TaxID=67305 RepID=UPI00365455E9
MSERARAKLNRVAARKTRPAKLRARSLVQLREYWRASARDFLATGADLIDSLLERARAAAAAIRARVAAVVDVALAAVTVTATVFVMNNDGCFHRRHLLAEARRHLALVQRGRRREPGLDETIVNEAFAAHCTDITEARTERGEEPGYRLYTARWAPAAPPRSRIPAAVSGRDRRPAADPAAPFLPLQPGEWAIPRVPLRHDRAVIAARVLTARLRTARRTGCALYEPAVSQQPAPEQPALFAQEQPSAAKPRPAVAIAALRIDLEALELAAEQLDQLARAGQQLAALRKEANQRGYQAASGGAPGAQDTSDVHHQDERHAHRIHPHEPGRGHRAPH